MIVNQQTKNKSQVFNHIDQNLDKIYEKSDNFLPSIQINDSGIKRNDDIYNKHQVEKKDITYKNTQ